MSILFRAPFDATSFALDSSDPPGEGPLEGGDLVRIRGRGFAASATVHFGALAASEVRVIHTALIEAVAPPSDAEAVVGIEVRQGADRASIPDAFRYRERAYPSILFDPEALNSAGFRSTDIALHDVRAGTGDLNADGRIDLVVSDPYGERAAVRILFGRDSWPELLEEADVTIWDEPAVVGFGEHFDLGADVDGYGFGDLVLGGSRPARAAPSRARRRSDARWPRVPLRRGPVLHRRTRGSAARGPGAGHPTSAMILVRTFTEGRSEEPTPCPPPPRGVISCARPLRPPRSASRRRLSAASSAPRSRRRRG